MFSTKALRAPRATLMAALIAVVAAFGASPLPAAAQAASEPAAQAPAAALTTAPTTAPTPAAAPAEVKAPAVAEEAVENPYGLKALWNQGDVVAKSTLVILLIMSMGSWYVIFTKLFEQRSMLKSAEASADSFWKAPSIKAGASELVEGPVGEALIMTAIGLAVAVPAVMGYNWLLRRNKNILDRVRAFGGDLHNVLIAGKR
ncbi:MAG: MotA/TolQ/ExbB proton channel family protein [Rubrivivax sp.]|nr:MotA/TolQ/ExbB proton channel family protein [Rubrivivax sp.]